MLYDFFLIELYYGTLESAQAQEDLVRRYGADKVENAISRGYLHSREIFFGPMRGKILCWLSDEGRQKAELSAAAPV